MILTYRVTVLWHFGCSSGINDVLLFTNTSLIAAATESQTKSSEQVLAFVSCMCNLTGSLTFPYVDIHCESDMSYFGAYINMRFLLFLDGNMLSVMN